MPGIHRDSWGRFAARRKLIAVAMPVALALVALGVWLQKDRGEPTDPDSKAAVRQRAVRPDPPAEGYVGSAVCARCHSAIARSYSQHPMWRSTEAVDPRQALAGDSIEDYGQAETFRPPGNRSYRVECAADRVTHYERMVDASGQVIYDQGVDVRYALGSGVRGRGYLIDRGGVLFASSISWYTEAGRWELSPGYSPRVHSRFARRVGDRCLSCHVGRVAKREGFEDHYLDPPFAEISIGCERCHGPGQRHVELQSSGSPREDDRSMIVNPARLEAARRDSVCYQCHLQGATRILRYGRGHFDFRPGDLIDDIWTVMVAPEAPDKQHADAAVSQVEQMRKSICYQASGGDLSCTSCHDPHSPHSRPGQDAALYYRARCLNCHAEKGCSLDEAQRLAVEDSCIRCHMPRTESKEIAHASQTDHSIRRKPAPADGLLAPMRTDPASLVIYDRGELRMAGWEVDRAKGLAMLDSDLPSHDRVRLARLAENLLEPVLRVVPDDTAVLKTLGQAAFIRHEHKQAREYLERALALEPTNEYVLSWLVQVCAAAGDTAAASDYVDRFLKINPWIVPMHQQAAELLLHAGDTDGGLEAARRALELDPTLKGFRRWLAEQHHALGRPDLARDQLEIIERMDSWNH
ncbi:MAG: tetratricopeptide repeat protein [Pirellulales bacterium]